MHINSTIRIGQGSIRKKWQTLLPARPRSTSLVTALYALEPESVYGGTSCINVPTFRIICCTSGHTAASSARSHARRCGSRLVPLRRAVSKRLRLTQRPQRPKGSKRIQKGWPSSLSFKALLRWMMSCSCWRHVSSNFSPSLHILSEAPPHLVPSPQSHAPSPLRSACKALRSAVGDPPTPTLHADLLETAPRKSSSTRHTHKHPKHVR